MRPCLIADGQRVGKAARGQKQRALALAFEQRVGCDRRSHLDRSDAACRQGGAGRHTQKVANALERRIRIVLRILRQQLPCRQAAIRRAANHISEGAAPIDPEIPSGVCVFGQGVMRHGGQTATGSGRAEMERHGTNFGSHRPISARCPSHFADAKAPETS